MYTRDSDARTIADEVMAEGTARGDTQLECNAKQSMYTFLAEHGAADTLGGWIDTVRELHHHPSHGVMAFIFGHKYLRDLFPQDVLDDFVELACRSEAGRMYIKFITDGYEDVLSDELAGLLPDEIDPDYQQGFLANDSVQLLVGDF